MIVITGAAGFIGSHLTRRLNAEGRDDLILVDDFSREDKRSNWQDLRYAELIHRNEFLDRLKKEHSRFEFVYHLGARTDTTDISSARLDRLNTDYSKGLWITCQRRGIPLVYASSAAVYGSGEHGYDDDDALTPKLKPLNAYGWSKLNFDQYVLATVIASEAKQSPTKDDVIASPDSFGTKPVRTAGGPGGQSPTFYAGLRFFNVYGTHEAHKGRMASVVHHAFRQVNETGRVQLFRSHREGVDDGEQMRDFIHVDDVVDVCLHFSRHRSDPGIYNVGTGRARTFLDLAKSVFSALGREPQIEFVDTPQDIREKYQYFTEARVEKLRRGGYGKAFVSLEDGVKATVEGMGE